MKRTNDDDWIQNSIDCNFYGVNFKRKISKFVRVFPNFLAFLLETSPLCVPVTLFYKQTVL